MFMNFHILRDNVAGIGSGLIATDGYRRFKRFRQEPKHEPIRCTPAAIRMIRQVDC